MLFSSITFIILFLPLTLLVYYCCPFIKAKNIILLIASLLFYAWGEPKFVLVMVCSIILNYDIGLLIGNTFFSVSKRKFSLALGVSINLLLLFCFKYLGFSAQILNSILKIVHVPEFQVTVSKIVLPLGISFYTFQSISYLVDVYRKPELVQRNILSLGLFISFFPQLIAGPIVRYHDINMQIRERKHSPELFTQGIERFIIGFAKKVLIANILAEYVDYVLTLPFASVPSIYLLLEVISSLLQLYYDFSGYSDMAIGMGKMFGFHIMENFNYPLASKSFTEFWRRWHISLTTWFRDYLYIPLGGSRCGKVRQMVNLVIVYALIGLWHGAEYHFIIFGLICGTTLILEKAVGGKVSSFFDNKGKTVFILKTILQRVFIFILIIFEFMLFNLTLKESLVFYSSLLNFTRAAQASVELLLLANTQFYIFLGCGLIFAFPWWGKLRIPVNIFTSAVKYTLLIALLLLSIGRLAVDAYNPFLYFRF
ncbi:MAG: MBOAT family protein [Treponema sp.]|jgi:alginate O-acetyltransferase complex protein AlgI|nr:MBOAT family protein [Treponema sp.]